MSSKNKSERHQFRYITFEEYIGQNNPVRHIDMFVDSLDLKSLNFKIKEHSLQGRPVAADEKDLLKLYIYGAMNKIDTSRDLAKQCEINLEVKWLMCGNQPGHVTISQFRKNNVGCFERVFKILRDRILSWTGIGYQSLDGSKIRASNAKDANFTLSKIDDRIENIKTRIDESYRKAKTIDPDYKLPQRPETIKYESKGKPNIKENTENSQGKQLNMFTDEEDNEETVEIINEEADDEEEEEEFENKDIERIDKSIKERQHRLALYEGYRDYMEENGLSQLSLTDADSKLMKSKNGYMVAYNVQMLVDSDVQIITAIKMTNAPADVNLMYETVCTIKNDYEEILDVTADKGYISTKDMANCLEHGIIPHVIMDDGVDSYKVPFRYEPVEISDEMLDSTGPDDIKLCLRSGYIPKCYSKYLSNATIEKHNLYEHEVDGYKEDMTEEEILLFASKGNFVRDPLRDRVYCPAKNILRRKSGKTNGTIRYANKLACSKCEARKKGFCTSSKNKEVDFPEKKNVVVCKNWMPIEYEDIDQEGNAEKAGNKEADEEEKKTTEYKQVIRRKLIGEITEVVITFKPNEEMMAHRFSLSEHPFGTIKEAMRRDSIHTRGLENASDEVHLSGIAYDMKRVSNLFQPWELRLVLTGVPKPDDYVYQLPNDVKNK